MACCEARCLEAVPETACRSEDCLVEQARRGDGEALERLFRRLAPAVMQQAQRLCGPNGMAQDVAQSALLLVLQHLGSLRQPERLGIWVRRIVTNAYRMEERSRASRSQREDEFWEAASRVREGEPALDAHRELFRVIRAAPRLPPLLAETFRLRVLEGLTTREAAAVLGVSPEVVRARLCRARRRLRLRRMEGP